MTGPRRKMSLVLVAALFAATQAWAGQACVAPENGGIGGTGSPALVGGVGGTGTPAAAGGVGGTGSPAAGGTEGTGSPLAAGGVGGTGHQDGDIGILGMVTGFGSVCVNGLEVHYERSLPVSENGRAADTGRLALGQVVAIEAAGPAGRLEARSVAILEAVSGPVTAGEKDGLLRVMDQPVRVTGDTRLSGVAHAGELQRGMPVRVSGYRNAAGEVAASRIETTPGLAEESQVISAPTTGGSERLLRGRWDGERFRPSSSAPALPFAGRRGQVVVEGLVLGHAGPGRLRISGFEVSYEAQGGTANAIAQAEAGQRVRITGWHEADGQVRASHAELLPLGSLGSGASSGGGMAPGGAMSGAGRMTSPAMGASSRLLPLVRPGAMGGAGGAGGMGGGHMGH